MDKSFINKQYSHDAYFVPNRAALLTYVNSIRITLTARLRKVWSPARLLYTVQGHHPRTTLSMYFTGGAGNSIWTGELAVLL
jgi:hypothetical protein